MPQVVHLHLVLPGALAQLRSGAALPITLSHWLQQARRQRLWMAEDLQDAQLDPWQQALRQALPAKVREHGLASASLQWRGEGGQWPTGSCLHVEPVHLLAGLDNLQLLLPPLPTAAEETQLLASLQPLMAMAGFDLQPSPSGQVGRWYLLADRQLHFTTCSPRAGIATRVYEAQPQGADAGALRRVMTEAQMLLHDHPVNQHRERRGVPTLNALWCWGGTPLQLVTQQADLRLIGDHPYVQGLGEHLHLQCWPLPANASALLSVAARELLLVLPEAELDAWSGWLDSLQQALQRGAIGQLDVYLDHWRLTLHGGRWPQFLRSIRRAAPVPELLA